MRWNDEDAWIVSEALTHEPLVSDEQFRAVRTLAATGRRRPVVRKARPTSQPFALHGLVVCALCHRKTQGSANHGRAHYRCRYPSEYAIANELDHPRNEESGESGHSVRSFRTLWWGLGPPGGR